MTEPPDPAADDLGRSYQELLQGQAWQLDVGEPAPAAETPAVAAETAEQRPAAKAPAPSQPPPLERILEAMLFVGGLPLTAERAAEVVRGLNATQFSAAVDILNRTYREQGRPYLVQRQEQGYLLALRPGYRSVLEKLFGGVREARLSLPAVDVLAIIAYRQPVTRQEVETLRGHESGAIIRQLVRRGLVTVLSRAESGGRDVQYGTTPRFLDLFGLSSLDDLPQTQDLQRL